MSKLIHSLLLSLAGAFVLALAVVLNLALAPILGFWLLGLDLALLFSCLIIATYLGEFSLPGIKILLKREYYRTKYKVDQYKKERKIPGMFLIGYLKLLAKLILLLKSAQEGFEVIQEEAEEFHGKALLFIATEKKKGQKALDQLFHIHKTKKRRAATLSATAVFLLIAGSLVTSIFSTLMYPDIFESSAATYTWTQTDWSGGSSDSVAQHSDGSPEQNWTYYESKDDNINIDGSGNITMSSGSQDTEYDSDSDFNQGSIVDNSLLGGYVENGSVQMKFGYDASGICSGFEEVYYEDSGSYNWSNAKNTCNNLCTDCALPTKSELLCICNNQTQLGDNYGTGIYWSSTPNYLNAYYVRFSDCHSNFTITSNSYSVRCVRR